MKSTLPFFAFVSFNVVPYENRSTKDYNGLEYLPDNNKAQREGIRDHEKLLPESMEYTKDQV